MRRVGEIEVDGAGRVVERPARRHKPISDRKPVEEFKERDECLREADTLADEMAKLKAQIEEAKFHAADTGEYADTNWFVRARTALRYMGSRYQRLHRRAAELRKGHSPAGGVFANRFVDAARRRLKPDVFQALMDEAREED